MIAMIAIGVLAILAVAAAGWYDLKMEERAEAEYWAEVEDEELSYMDGYVSEQGFYEIDTPVHVVNPFTKEFVYFSDPHQVRPSTHLVQAVVRDKEDGIFRYKLSGLNEYVAHGWLVPAVFGALSKKMPTMDLQLSEMMSDIEMRERGAKIDADLDRALVANSVDAVLDRINAATGEERARLLESLRKNHEQRGENV